MTASPALTSSGLVKKFPGELLPAVDNLNVVLTAGEIWGLLGPNGAGKTSAISMMCGLMLPTQGEVEIFGHRVGRNNAWPRHWIGLAPQKTALYPTMTIGENLSYFGQLHGMNKHTRQERIESVITLTDLKKQFNRTVANCSGGMVRRANLAIAVLHNPRLLFLDEPTVGVDVQSRNRIYENLQQLNDSGMTMVYTTHYLEEAARLCSSLSIMDAGRILVSGSVKKLQEQFPDYPDLEKLFIHLTGQQLRE